MTYQKSRFHHIDAAGQPKNDAGETVYGTKYKFYPAANEWKKVTSFVTEPEFSYDYGLNDVYTKKGLDEEKDEVITEFWLPKSKSSSKYFCKAGVEGKKYASYDTSSDPAAKKRIEAGDPITTLTGCTDITYIDRSSGQSSFGSGVYGNTKLSISNDPVDTEMREFAGYEDGNGKKIAGRGTEAHQTGTLYASTDYADADGKWNAKYGEMALYLRYRQIKYYVSYDKNRPSNASHGVSGTMSDGLFLTAESSTLSQNDYSLKGWDFKGWNTKPDGSGTSYGDGENVKNLTIAPGDTVTLYAQL